MASGTSGGDVEQVITFSSKAGLDAAAVQDGETDGGDSTLVTDFSVPGVTATLSGTVMKLDGPVADFQSSMLIVGANSCGKWGSRCQT
jgi:hypothetical protein